MMMDLLLAVKGSVFMAPENGSIQTLYRKSGDVIV
jgi:hypothetical protein